MLLFSKYLKYAFSTFLGEKAEKGRKSKKFDPKFSKISFLKVCKRKLVEGFIPQPALWCKLIKKISEFCINFVAFSSFFSFFAQETKNFFDKLSGAFSTQKLVEIYNTLTGVYNVNIVTVYILLLSTSFKKLFLPCPLFCYLAFNFNTRALRTKK